ncbi:MAG: hypothetical protein RIE31_07395 [Alphaproteobacteria bacterium]
MTIRPTLPAPAVAAAAPAHLPRRALLLGGIGLLLVACGKKDAPRAPKDLQQSGQRPGRAPAAGVPAGAAAMSHDG